MMRTTKVWADNVKYVVFVLKRDNIPFHMETRSDGNYSLTADLSVRRLSEVLKDATCEKERKSMAADIPVYSYETLMNREKFNRLCKINGRNSFHILKKDYEKYTRAIG